jgi:hypothetical protein
MQGGLGRGTVCRVQRGTRPAVSGALRTRLIPSPALSPPSNTTNQVKAEIEDLKAEATRLLDLQLGKSAEAIRKEQEVAMAALHRKLEAARGSKWAAKFQEDLAFVAWFDGAVAQDPANGPRAATA